MPLVLLPIDFKNAFPEFADADDDLVSEYLAFATTRVPEAIWGDFTAEGRLLWTAKLLAMSPFARKIGLVDAKGGGQTSYDIRLQSLVMTVAPRGVAL